MNTAPLRFLPLLALTAALLGSPVLAQSYDFGFPPGVDWNNATPEQISDAVFNAVKSNPDAAPDIAVAGLQSAAGTGRWTRVGSQDGKQSVDPDGSSGDSFENIANTITDAAKRGNPAMAPQIDSAVAGALPGIIAGLGDPGGGGGGGGGGVGVPPPVPGGFGGGGGTTTSTGDS